jgi:hypothetical protein
MQRKTTRTKGKVRPRLTYANVVATLALFIALGGASAFASSQLAKNSVGSRQLKSKSVTTGKVAQNAINGSKVANGSLTGEDIRLSALGTVPSATSATSAGNANTVGGHSAACPESTTLIRGLCYDTHANPVANNLEEAAESCAEKGGYLPAPMQLFSARGVLNLGTGVGNEQHQFTDSLYNKPGEGTFRTIVVNGAGFPEEYDPSQPSAYTCVYPLVR